MDRVHEDLGDQLKLYVQAALGRKASDLLLLDVRELTTLADVFMLCTGRSNRQVSAIADHIRRFLKDHGIRPLYVEGMKEGHWVLLDYGQVVIHVFYEPVRQFYDLESLWADARPLPIDDFVEELPDDDQTDGATT
ncbi:MAG TPA: ribosome silencing factor [Desulfosalsimonadaceae bacterium]|nr:ribosome silencing factor [Desulfosalsimonadaceae bacterium]